MFGIIPKKYKMRAILAAAFFAVVSTGVNAQGNSNGSNGAASGQPIDNLQDQIDALQSQVDTLIAIVNQDPIEMDVDCAAGGTVSSAIASGGDAPNPLVITIIGTCNESVFILRDNVTLKGQSPTDGITGNFAVLASQGANHVFVESMTLDGGFAGLSCLNGSAVTATNVNIINGDRGVLAFYGGDCEVIDSTIDNNVQGLTIGTNSNIWLRGVDVINSESGANVYTNGSLSLDASPNTGAYSLVSGGNRGLNIFANGSVRPVKVVIENNAEVGIWSHSGGSIFFDSAIDVDIRNNDSHGIVVDKLTNAFLRGGLRITGNGGYGLQCYGTHSIFDFDPSTVSGNIAGDIHPDCEIYP